MKFVFLMTSYDTMYFFKGIADRLTDLGHKITVIHSSPSPCSGGEWNVTQKDWQRFDIDLIHEINPDRILVWNGYQYGASAVTTMLKSMYKVFHVEMAWLPQNKYLYIDEELGPRSTIARTVEIKDHFTDEEHDMLDQLRLAYRPKWSGRELPKKYIFVPLQLEYDTAITMFSPYFKTMDSLVGYIQHHSGDCQVLVKPHPKEESPALHPSVTLIRDISATELAARAYAIAGINSTALIEAMVFYKPIINFGDNVAMKAMGLYGTPISDFVAEPAHVTDSKLLHLLKNQVDFLNPQDWVIDKLTRS